MTERAALVTEVDAVPLVLLWPVTPACEADDHARLIEPRDLSLVDRPARQ